MREQLFQTNMTDTDLVDTSNGRTALSLASEDGRMMVVKALLQIDTTEADSKDMSGRTPLSWAAGNGHEAAVKLLLDTGKVDADSKCMPYRIPGGGWSMLPWPVKNNNLDANLKDAMSGQTPLSWAAKNGHEAVVKLLLDTGKVAADSKDTSDKTPLSQAAKNGHEAVVKLLLDTGKVDADSKDASGKTPLSRAAKNRHEAVVKLLLDTGRVDTDSKDTSGRTPLSLAAESGHEAVVKLLLNTGKVDADSKDTSGQTPLFWAAESGYEAVIKLLLNTGEVDPDCKDEWGRTPLSRAANNGHDIVVNVLLNTGKVNPDSKDISGHTPLSWAAQNGYETIVSLLLDTGRVDPDSEGDWYAIPLWWTSEYGRNGTDKINEVSGDTRLRRTPLSLAAEAGHNKVVKLLLDSGKVDVDLKNTASGQTPLSWAARSGHEGVVRLLLENDKVDPDSKDRLGRTPLWLAARSGYLQVVKQLLNTSKVDPDWRDKFGGTPLLWAARNGHDMVVKVLLDTGKVNADLKDTVSGQTPLSWAARSGHEVVVKLLLDSGKADPDSKDEHGLTPLLWALEEGHQAVVKRLRDTNRVDDHFETNVGLEIVYRFLTRWIKACDERHNGYCQPTPVHKRRPHQIPDWVIDTRDARIVPGHTVSQYTALSYAWNSDEVNAQPPQAGRLLLKQSNLFEFQKPGYLNGIAELHLPQVIKDAIDVVRKLGERFLWVDCLCIVQDSKRTRAQVEHMDEIYSGAYFTIIAATSSGLLDMRKNTNKQKMPTHTLFGQSGVKSYIEDLYKTLFDSKWATRGWTFQEQILSNRSVIFVNGDMFWECQQCVWDKNELSPWSNSEVDGSYTSRFKEMARQIFSTSWPNFGMYIEMACLYNKRDFSYPQDSLPGFCGILNSFARSFAFGFVGGLPELFLDTALLWQPFSKARRRTVKEGGAVALQHLPSWSWCGWECPIDPFSLRSGLAYVDCEDYQSRASTWKTQGIVQWSIMSEDMQQELLCGPLELEQYKDLQKGQDVELPEGWSRLVETSSEALGGSDVVYFVHTSDPTSRFKHPVPIRDAALPTSLGHNNWPFLSCSAGRAFFQVRAVLRPAHRWELEAGLFLSVFDLPEFKFGPAAEDTCDVLCLKDMQGKSAGVLRCMDNSNVEPNEEIELIAISKGSASRTDMESAFEEKVEKYNNYSYRNGLTTTWFHRALPGGRVECKDPDPFKDSCGFTCRDEMPQDGTPIRDNTFPDTESNAKKQTLESMENRDGEDEYHYYNVLWIERDGDIVYRRAAGRVPKDVWEQNCSTPIKIILG